MDTGEDIDESTKTSKRKNQKHKMIMIFFYIQDYKQIKKTY